MGKVYFQIGTNDGNDMFRHLVKRDKPDIVILVEPNKNLLDHIKNNYSNIENVYIYNNAIYYQDDEDVELVIPAKKGYSSLHFSLVPMNDWGNKEDMIKITSKSITFGSICNRHNITDIDYLQIDTEGFDSEIIKMIDLSKYKIKTIRFEKWGFSVDRFTRYNEEKCNELGENGMKYCIDKLTKHNYKITYIEDMMGNDYIAELSL